MRNCAQKFILPSFLGLLFGNIKGKGNHHKRFSVDESSSYKNGYQVPFFVEIFFFEWCSKPLLKNFFVLYFIKFGIMRRRNHRPVNRSCFEIISCVANQIEKMIIGFNYLAFARNNNPNHMRGKKCSVALLA